MTVAELITYLQGQPQDLLVAYRCFSEQVLMEAGDIKIAQECAPRQDGRIQHRRDDMPSQKYLMFLGN